MGIQSVFTLTSQPSSPAGKHAARRPAPSACSPTPLLPSLIPATHSFLHSLAHHLFPATSTGLTQVDAQQYVRDGWMEGRTCGWRAGPIWKGVVANLDAQPVFIGLYQFLLPVPASLYTKAFTEASEGCPAREQGRLERSGDLSPPPAALRQWLMGTGVQILTFLPSRGVILKSGHYPAPPRPVSPHH